MFIGCHVSIAGGIENAPGRAAELGCEVFQIFSRSPRGGPAPKILSKGAGDFKKAMAEHGQKECYIHTPYYINFVSKNKAICRASSRIVREELERGSLIGARYVMTHLGSAKDVTEAEGTKMTKEGIQAVLKGYRGSTALLLEISAGSGSVIGDTFDELAQIMKGNKVGICLDTAHLYASGYDIKTQLGMTKTLKIIRDTVGRESLKLLHANDSKVGLGEHKDRHDHIGDGKIGLEGFKIIGKTFKDLNFILETEHDKVKEDISVLKRIRAKLG